MTFYNPSDFGKQPSKNIGLRFPGRHIMIIHNGGHKMIQFQCLIIKTYRSIKIPDQQRIVTELGFCQDGVIWTLNVHTVNDVKRIESQIMNKVPYFKKVIKWAKQKTNRRYSKIGVDLFPKILYHFITGSIMIQKSVETKMSRKKELVTEIVTESQLFNCEELMTQLHTKSAVIRYLSSKGQTRSQILKIMQESFPKFRYQHVRNVLITPVKKT